MSAASKLRSLPPAARRGVAIAVLCAALLTAWLLVVVPIEVLATSQQDWREATAARIATDRGLVKSGARVRELAGVVANAPVRARVFEARSSMPVDDQLQGELSTALLKAGVEPTTFKVLPGDSELGLRQHRIEFSSIMSVDQLRGMYGYLAQQPHYLRIERVRIQAPPTQKADENPRMTVLMEVRGFSLDAPKTPENRRVARAD